MRRIQTHKSRSHGRALISQTHTTRHDFLDKMGLDVPKEVDVPKEGAHIAFYGRP